MSDSQSLSCVANFVIMLFSFSGLALIQLPLPQGEPISQCHRNPSFKASLPTALFMSEAICAFAKSLACCHILSRGRSFAWRHQLQAVHSVTGV